MEFPQKVLFARKQLGLSQEELAHALNVSHASINRWERAKTTPTKMAQDVFNSFCKNHNISFEPGKES